MQTKGFYSLQNIHKTGIIRLINIIGKNGTEIQKISMSGRISDKIMEKCCHAGEVERLFSRPILGQVHQSAASPFQEEQGTNCQQKIIEHMFLGLFINDSPL